MNDRNKDRRLAREIALQFLYQWDIRGEDVAEEMTEVLAKDRRSAEVAEYAKELLRGVTGDRDGLDAQITAAAENWRVDRMAAIDRNILRMGIWEMDRRREDVPPKVAINEAIELAKRFSTENSGAFVNGVLDRVRRALGL